MYLSPDPPTEDSFVKIWEEGLYEMSDVPFGAGKWATTSDIAANHGHMNVRVPAGLKPGQYVCTCSPCRAAPVSGSLWLRLLTKCLLAILSVPR